MKVTKFGNIVREVKVNVDRDNNPYEFYIAGDHMDSEDLTIHRKGKFSTDDVGPAFTRIFKPGQILYGSRRTYLKKIAVADFEGICANTTFVLETKDDNVFLQSLLPFIMLSDKFTEWSVSHSKGSTNPYVLFSDLASYEFELPSLEEQRVLAEKLWAAYRLKESYKRLLAATDEMVKSQFIEMFGNTSKEMLGKFIQVIRGVSYKPSDVKTADDPDTAVILRSNNINDANLNTDEVVYIDKNRVSGDQYLRINDIVVCASNGSKALVGKAAINKTLTNQYAHGAFCLLVRPNDNINHVYLNTFFQTSLYKKQIDELAAGSNILNIKQEHLTNMILPLPIIEEQNKFAIIAEQADKSKFELRKSIDAIDKVIKSLINE